MAIRFLWSRHPFNLWKHLVVLRPLRVIWETCSLAFKFQSRVTPSIFTLSVVSNALPPMDTFSFKSILAGGDISIDWNFTGFDIIHCKFYVLSDIVNSAGIDITNCGTATDLLLLQSYLICLSNQAMPRGPFKEHGLALIPRGINNYIYYKMWDGITNPCPNFNDATAKMNG